VKLPVVCGTVIAVLAFTASAEAAIPSGPPTRDAYDVWTIGDSYAAGEGAPDADGVYRDNGDVVDGQYEDWDVRFGGPPSTPGLNQDSTRCHRSGSTSTSAVATAALQAEFPDVNVAWVSVACSGASIVQTGKFKSDVPPHKGGVLRDYDGVDNLSKRGVSASSLSPAAYPPQLTQINQRLAGTVDALVMNLGGNDAGFGELIAQCMNIVPGAGECNTNADLGTFVTDKFGLLNGRFNRLAAALQGNPASGDPKLDRAPRSVFLTQAPNPLKPTASSFCDRQPKGNYEENLTAAESTWLDANVVRPLNARFKTEADQHGWNLVTSHVDAFTGHAICTAAPANWINTNLQALRKQGELDETNSGFAEVALIDVSGGIAHPNRDGFAAMGGALRTSMRPVLVDFYTPDSAPATQVPALTTGFSVSMTDPAPALASGYWHRIRLRQFNADGTTSNVSGADNLRDIPYGTQNVNYARTGRYFVTARACGPLSRSGAIGCGPTTAELPVSTFTPAAPTTLTADGKAPPGVFFPSPGITVGWKHANVQSRHDTRRSIVRLTGGGKTLEKTVNGPFTSTRVTGLSDGQSYAITVKACNDGNRCSATIGPVSATADQGTSPAAKISDLERIETQLEGVPCSTQPVPFDPALSGTPGFEDSTPSFRPGCLTEPSVGRLSLARRVTRVRRGRFAKLSLRWTAPGQWRSLHEVTVAIGKVSLRFRQDANEVTLGGRSLPVGKAGTLKARGVRVRVGDTALEGSGPAGRDMTLRFAVRVPRTTGIAVGASNDTGQVQTPVAAGSVRVRIPSRG
jgi:hypothetical protein